MEIHSIDYLGTIINKVEDEEKAPTSLYYIKKFIAAFKEGNVEKALESFDEAYLYDPIFVDDAVLFFIDKDHIAANCVLGEILHNHASWYDADIETAPALVAKRIEILKRIISSERNKGADYEREIFLKSFSIHSCTPLMFALDAAIPELVSAFLKREDVDVNRQVEVIAWRGTEKVSAFSLFLDHFYKSKDWLECLTLLLKSEKVDLSGKQLRLLLDKKDDIKNWIEDEFRSRKIGLEVSPYREDAKAFDSANFKIYSLEKPARPERPKGILFGSQKKAFDAAMAYYSQKNDEYVAAENEYNRCKTAKEKYDAQKAKYAAEEARLVKLYRIVENVADAALEREKQTKLGEHLNDGNEKQ